MLKDNQAVMPPQVPLRPLGVTLLGSIYLFTGLLSIFALFVEQSSFYESFGAIHALPASWGRLLVVLAMVLCFTLATGLLGQRRWGWKLAVIYFSYISAVSLVSFFFLTPVHPWSQRYLAIGPLLLLYLRSVRHTFVR